MARQLEYACALYEDVVRHYGERIGARHARKHLGWSLDFAARISAAPSNRLKIWRQKILTSESVASVHRLLREAFDDFAWSAAA